MNMAMNVYVTKCSRQIDLPLISYAVRRPMAQSAWAQACIYPLSIYLATHEHLILGFYDEATTLRTLERLREAASMGL